MSFVFITGLGVETFAEERVVRVAGDPYPPWTEGEAGSKATGGVAVEIVQQLFDRLGMKTLTVVYPFERGMQRIKDGSEDVILMVSKTQEREAFISFTPPIRNSRWVFFHLKEKDFQWTQWEDLKPYRIGYVTGNNVGKEFPAAAEKYNYYIEEVKADIFNARKLLLGRIDIALTDVEVMQRIIELNPEFQNKLDWNEKPVFESFYHLGISKKSFLAPMLPKIKEVLEQMKGDGTFQEIFCKYGKEYQGSCEGD
jgi:polar amino acid transport system substrate-binding protein